MDDNFSTPSKTASPAGAGEMPAMPLEDLVAALAKAPLLRDVELPQLRLLAFSARERQVAAGRMIETAGTRDAPAYLVTHGDVMTSGHSAGPGTLINAPGALAGLPLSGDIVARTDACLLVVDRALVARLIREYPAMGRAMMRALGQDLRGLAQTVRAQAAASTPPQYST